MNGRFSGISQRYASTLAEGLECLYPFVFHLFFCGYRDVATDAQPLNAPRGSTSSEASYPGELQAQARRSRP